MNSRYSEPSIDKIEFNCPRCGVRATQAWQHLYCQAVKDGGLPVRISHAWIDNFEEERKGRNEPGVSDEVVRHWRRMADNDLFLSASYEHPGSLLAFNMNAAICQHCKGISVWINSDMVFPLGGEVPAQDDMPEAVKGTFAEASKILTASPRASAALARLAIQQLCVELGARKKNLDDQIGELVAAGLSTEIQMMLDSVRVIGNNAVHPGEINLKDDKETARFLLECINRICQRLITEKKQVADLYTMLPQGARDAIDRRNSKLLTERVEPESLAGQAD